VSRWSWGCGWESVCVGWDEVGEGDDVVDVAAGCVVEGSAAGDEPQSGVVEVVVHRVGGERVLGEGLYSAHPEYRNGGVGPGEGDLGAGFRLRRLKKTPGWPPQSTWPVMIAGPSSPGVGAPVYQPAGNIGGR